MNNFFLLGRTVCTALLVFTLLLSCKKSTTPMDDDALEIVIEGIYYADNAPIQITVKNGMISEIERPAELGQGNNYLVAPGLIDHQVNGYLSHSFVGGDLDAAGLKEVTEGFWKKGITTYLPTLTTQTDEVLLKSFENIAQLLEDDEHLAQSIPGFHLEGTFYFS